MKTIAIVQSCYLPWKGYFDLIRRSDIFVLYDCVQYTPRDWRNRNRIKTPNGLHWLTIPVHASRKQRICDVSCADEAWKARHWETIQHVYAKAPYFRIYAQKIQDLYQTCDSTSLSDINHHFLTGICRLLNISTPIHVLRQNFSPDSDKTQKLANICQHYNATRYLSGMRAKNYLDIQIFDRLGIEVEWIAYDYQEYPQIYPPFEHYVSIIDMLFNVGDNWMNYMSPTRN